MLSLKTAKILIVILASVLLFSLISNQNKSGYSYNLENGVKVICLPEESAFATIHVFIKDWKAHETKKGTANLALQMLSAGTTTKSKLELADTLENIGADLSFSLKNDYAEISASVLAENLPQFLDLLSEVLNHPAYPEKEFIKLKQDTIANLAREQENPFWFAVWQNRERNYSGHYYGYPPEGTLSELKSINYADILQLKIPDKVNPRDVVIVVNGKLNAREIQEPIKKLSGAFTNQTILTEQGRAITFPNSTQIEKGGFQTSIILYNLLAPDLINPKRSVYVLINSYLGSGLTSPLFQLTREQNELGYNVGSYLDTTKKSSLLTFYVQTNRKDSTQTTKLLDNFLAKIPLPTKAEFQKAKNYLLTSFFEQRQSTLSRGESAGFYEVMGLGWHYDFPKKLRQIRYQSLIQELQHLTKLNIFILQ